MATATVEKTKRIKYSNELAVEICKRIMHDNKPLSKVCEDKDMPGHTAVYDWLAEHNDFADKYTHACKIRRERRFERLTDIAYQIEDVNRARLLIDTEKWQLSKEEPKKYGKQLDITSDGKALPSPIIPLPAETE